MVAGIPDSVQPIFPSTDVPAVVTAAPPLWPNQAVPEPPTFGLLLTGLLAILWCQRNGGFRGAVTIPLGGTQGALSR